VTVTTVTGPGGSWSVSGLPAGNYTVTADPSTFPPKFHSSIGQTTSLTLPAGGSRTVITGITTVILAYTGTDASGMFTVAILLLIAGLGIMLLRRRRRA
jgi:LPXTG-motif cell wall-anchored protein